MYTMGPEEHATIRAVLDGNNDAYGALVKRHSRTLFRVAWRICGNEADAEDVVQESLLRGYQKLETFESRADFGTWIYRIAVRCALDKIAKRRGHEARQVGNDTDPEQETVQVADGAAGPDRILLSGEIGAMCNTALNSLTPAERGAFLLRHVEGKSTEEIAEVLGIAPNTAKQTVFRAVQKMRQRLSKLKVQA